MEKWQQDHIQKNISQLVDYTLCDITFLLAFQSNGLLTPKDVSKINSIQDAHNKSAAFYDLIQKRANSYETLRAILKETKQTGALSILEQVNSQNAFSPFKNSGTISYDKRKLLGKGSYNTKVYQGRFDDRDVAVKMLSFEDVDGKEKEIALKEINILKEMDWHINVVRYFKAEIREDFILIAIELCTSNLQEWVASSYIMWKVEVEILKQITQGLAHLHYNKIVHRDLKPENILICCQDGHIIQAKLSDFGLSRKLKCGQSKVTMSTKMVGTDGWIAPEVVKQLDDKSITDGKFTVGPYADIFSLGCIFYFVLSGGDHPFGSSIWRQANILYAKFKMTPKAMKTIQAHTAEPFIWLIQQMIKQDDKDRPKAEVILTHPAFWESRKIFTFFEDIYPYIETYHDVLEKLVGLNLGMRDWISALDISIQQVIRSNLKVNCTNGAHLLKVIVEMKRGYSKLPADVKMIIGDEYEGFVIYWGNRFPFFLPLIWVIFQYSLNIPATLSPYYYLKDRKFKFGIVDYFVRGFTIDKLGRSLIKNDEALLQSLIPLEVESELASKRIKLSSAGISQQDFNGILIATGELDAANLHNFPSLPINYMKRNVKSMKGLLEEEQFLNTINENDTNTTIAICGSTGMGKTTFLAQMAVKILNIFPDRKSFYFEMKKVVDAVKAEFKKGKMPKTELILCALRDLTGESKLGKSRLNRNADNCKRPRIELFFDELDNVQSKDRDIMWDALKIISINAPSTSIRMFIGLLPKDLIEMQKLGNFHSYTLEPLDEYGQVEIIVSYWEMDSSQAKEDLVDLVLKYIRGLKNRRDIEFGNPLQCLLIGAAIPKEGNIISLSSFQLLNPLFLNSFSGNLLLDAAWHRSFHTLEFVLKLNKFEINCVDKLGNTPLFLSVYKDDNVDCLRKLKLLIEWGANLNHLNQNKENLLLMAACYGSHETLDYVLGLNKFDINSVDIDESTPLLRSARDNNPECLLKLKLLISRGANLDHLNKKHYNFLLYAARYGSVEILNYVLSLKKFDINCMDIYEHTPLFLSVVLSSNIDCVQKMKVLIDAGVNLHHFCEKENVFSFAAGQSSAEVLEYLLDTNEFDINSHKMNELLLKAVFQQDGMDCLKKVKLLVNQSANLNCGLEDGYNMLHHTAAVGKVEVLEYVISLGIFDINSVDDDGRTALYYARKLDFNKALTSFDVESKANLLIQKGCKSEKKS